MGVPGYSTGGRDTQYIQEVWSPTVDTLPSGVTVYCKMLLGPTVLGFPWPLIPEEDPLPMHLSQAQSPGSLEHPAVIWGKGGGVSGAGKGVQAVAGSTCYG